MHGMIMDELRRYVKARLGGEAWVRLLKEAGLGSKTYFAVLDYPDSETLNLVSTASTMTGIPIPDLLEDFGAFIAPDLVSMCRVLIRPEWRTLDFLEHTEEMVHELVRRNWRVKPPQLQCSRPSPSEVVITYSSARKLCHVAKGIGKGAARYFQEEVTIGERSCMLRGDQQCVISVRLVRPSRAPDW